MSRWIDADALSEKIDNIWDGRPLSSLGARILTMINSAPSIDIVRCKECAVYMTDGYASGCGFCGFHHSVVEADDFCSYGERREPRRKRRKEQTMIISKNRYKNLIDIINSQKQLIEEYKGKITMLEEQDELKSQLIRKLERLVVRRTDDE